MNLKLPSFRQSNPDQNEEDKAGAQASKKSPAPDSSILVSGLILLLSLPVVVIAIRSGGATRGWLAAGILWAIAVTLLLYAILSTDNRIARKLDWFQEQARSGRADLLLLQKSLFDLHQMHSRLSETIESLKRSLEHTQQCVDSIRQAVLAPGALNDPAMRQKLEPVFAYVQQQAKQNTGVVKRITEADYPKPPKPSVPETSTGFTPSPSSLTPQQRLQEALAYYRKRLASASKSALVNFQTLEEAAANSMEMEKDLAQNAEKLLKAENYFEWDFIDRDVYQAVRLPVSLQAVTEQETSELFALEQELILYRRHLHQTLGRQYGVQPIEVIPGVTRLDLNLHKTTEDGWLRTTDAANDLVIYEVVAAGFTRRGETMRKPDVRYYRCTGMTLSTTATEDKVPANPILPSPPNLDARSTQPSITNDFAPTSQNVQENLPSAPNFPQEPVSSATPTPPEPNTPEGTGNEDRSKPPSTQQATQTPLSGENVKGSPSDDPHVQPL